MERIRTILIDDEFLALNLLEEFTKQFPQLEVVGKFKSALDAAAFMRDNDVDVMFLDIQMPHLSGNQFLKTLSHPPVTIFTTAYSDYAVEAFSLNAVDYLLKPFSFERFFQAVQKAEEALAKKNPSNPIGTQSTEQPSFITIKSDGVLSKVKISDILIVEGLKEYVKIITPNKKYIQLESMKNMELSLPADQFIRVHKSYIVARNQITSIEGYFIYLGKVKIPISRTKKQEILELVFGV